MPQTAPALSSLVKAPDASCRPSCGACCIAPSITSPIPGMPNGKPAGVPCVQLDDDMRCRIFGRPERPAFCGGLQPSRDMCGESALQAMRWLADLEAATRPDSQSKVQAIATLRKPA